MITIGVDAHKRVHVAVALDAAGRVVAQWKGANRPDAWQALRQWARDLGGPRQWGIEGAWNYGRGLAQYLVAADEVVYEINPRWTAEGRKTARRRGKNDALDALSAARLVRGEGAASPRVGTEDETALLDLLVTEREGAQAEATRLRNQLHQLLLQIDPEYASKLPGLKTAKGVAALLGYENTATALKRARAAAVRRTAQRLRLALDHVAELEQQLATRAEAAGLARCGACAG